MITQQYANELFDYADGQLFWKVRKSQSKKVGDLAGSINKLGYVRIVIDRKEYLAHRIIYLMHNGAFDGFIDHIDRNPSNNKIENLRIATNSQNQANTIIRKTNTSGYLGVYWCKVRKKWKATIKVNGKHLSIGRFNNPLDAHKAYMEKRKFYFGEFANY